MYGLGDRIRELRKQHGLSQAALGEKIGRSKAAVVSYESDRQAPPLEVLISIADLFNVTLDSLVSYKPKGFLVGLDNEQSKFVCRVRDEFLAPTSRKGELSETQVNLVSDLLALLKNSEIAEK